jgi:hypothetical protein
MLSSNHVSRLDDWNELCACMQDGTVIFGTGADGRSERSSQPIMVQSVQEFGPIRSVAAY